MEPVFRVDLYRGTAVYYDRYRPPYPNVLFDDLCRRLPASGAGRLLDLACGTGQIAFPLAGRFAEVWAVDQEPELVAFGQRMAQARGITNVRWLAGSAETVRLDGSFELVAVGNAFHRLNRPAVARRMFSWVRAGGGVALLWSSNPWSGEQPWQQSMSAMLKAWIARMRATRRVPAGWEQAVERHPHDQVLGEAGFDLVGTFDFVVEQTWTAQSLAGLVYSTSFLNRQVLGDQAAAFEQDLTELLRSQHAEEVLRVPTSYAYQLARKPEVA